MAGATVVKTAGMGFHAAVENGWNLMRRSDKVDRMEDQDREDTNIVNQIEQDAQAPQPVEQLVFDEDGFRAYILKLKEEQNLVLAIIVGGAAALLGAILWAIQTVITDYQIGILAIGIGLLVGFAVRLAGKGFDRIYGILAGLLSLLGIIAGNVFTVWYYVAEELGISIFETAFELMLDPLLILQILVETFTLIDLVFYALAIYYAYRTAFRKISQEELNKFYYKRPVSVINLEQ